MEYSAVNNTSYFLSSSPREIYLWQQTRCRVHEQSSTFIIIITPFDRNVLWNVGASFQTREVNLKPHLGVIWSNCGRPGKKKK